MHRMRTLPAKGNRMQGVGHCKSKTFYWMVGEGLGWLETVYLQVPTCLIGNIPTWTTDVVETADKFP